MAVYYGVNCEDCGKFLMLGDLNPDSKGQKTFYTTLLEPIPCIVCGSSYQYGSDSLVDENGDKV
jgi:hypothetical protein